MIIDDIIGWLSPRAKFKRVQYRKALAVLGEHKRAYEGASRSRRTEGWRTSSTSATTEIGAGLTYLRNRSRDLIRNNPYACRGVNIIASNVIGKGIVPSIKTGGRENDDLMALWRDWAETPACDYDGRLNFYALQKLVMQSVVESGEVLIRRRFTADGVLPIRLQVLESDFLPLTLPTSNALKGNVIIQGVEFDPDGRRVAYHLYKEHPGNVSLDFKNTTFDTVRVPAEDILHIGRGDRPGQVRFAPWLAPVIIRLRDFDEYEDAQLVRQKIAACFAVFVHDLESQGDLNEEEREALGEKVEPGLIEILPPGKDIKFATPPTVENYAEYASVNLHAVASGLGITYEALTGDLREVNFSSARMGWLEMNRNIECWRAHIVDPQLNAPTLGWFFDGARLVGVSPEGAVATWTAPRREMIDPTKEVPAAIKSVRAGITSLSDVIRQSGKHPTTLLNEIKTDNELIDRLGLTLDSDPRKVDMSGSSQNEGAV